MKLMYWGLKGNQGTMVICVPISFRIFEMIWLLLWLNDESIYNHFDRNEIKVLLKYGDCKWIIVKSIDLEYNIKDWDWMIDLFVIDLRVDI